MTAPSAQTCIVLAGGLGTRLRSAVPDLPKCLAPIGSRPFIEIQIESLLRAGVNDVVLSLGHMADKVVEALATMPQRDRTRTVIEPSLLGTGGAILFAMDQLGLDEVLVANGDTYLDGDLDAMLTPLDRAHGEFFRMAVVEVADRARFGGIRVDDKAQVLGFLEKGQTGPGLINAGLYRLCRAALTAQPDAKFSLEADVLPALVVLGSVRAWAVAGHFIDIGVPDDYRRFCQSHGGPAVKAPEP